MGGLLAAIASGIIAYRSSGPYGELGREDQGSRRIVDPTTGRLRLLIYDSDGNGTFDTWSHMDGDRVLRMEFDTDGDGLIDRSEFFNANGVVERVVTSGTNKQGLDRSLDGNPSGAGPSARPHEQVPRS